ncbi:hypothetical protein Tco_0016750 [Tanacetum coccineum]
MNPRCSALLRNQLPPKEEDLGSFILPCSIGRLDFNNALADLGASINIMPFSMYKRLGMGKLEPINMVIKMEDNTKTIKSEILIGDDDSEPCDFNQLLDIDPDILAYDINMHGSYKEADTNKEKFKEYETVEQCLNLAEKRVHWCEALSQEKEGLRKYWASCDPHNNICDVGGLPNDVERLYWESTNDYERVDLEWEELSFNN